MTAADRPLLLRAVPQRRAFEAILEQLEEAIASGELEAGSKLPTERELAAALDVSRTSVREALRVLEALGLLGTRRGGEHGATLLEKPGNAFTQLFRLQLGLRHIDVPNVIDCRAMTEAWAIEHLAQSKDAAALERLEELVAEMGRDGLAHEAFHELDAEFHLVIVRASENELAVLFADALRNTVRRLMLDALFSAENWPHIVKTLTDEHRAIVNAAKSGDGLAASRLLRAHIERWGGEAARVQASLDAARSDIGAAR
jgi:DNA-binding FadR family transcriptional regulator